MNGPSKYLEGSSYISIGGVKNHLHKFAQNYLAVTSLLAQDGVVIESGRHGLFLMGNGAITSGRMAPERRDGIKNGTYIVELNDVEI